MRIRMKTILGLVSFVLFSIILAQNTQASSAAAEVIADVLNVRSGPGTEYDRVDKVMEGTMLSVLGEKGEWTEVKLSNGTTGWVMSQYIRLEGNSWIKSTTDQLNVRSKPNSSASIVQVINKNDIFEQLDQQGNWVEIRLSDKQTGWVNEKYIESTEDHVIIVETDSNLRVGPGVQFDKVGKVQPGNTYPILEAHEDWYKIALGGEDTAYIASWIVQTDVVENISPDPVSEQVATGQQEVFIYHTHNRESWKNVARDNKGTSVDDPEINITLVGKKLGKLLEDKGINSVVSQDDIARRLADQKLGFSKSYQESGKVVQAAAKQYSTLEYYIDIHRDSESSRSKTAVTIDGKVYARILFVVGAENKSYEANQELAETLSEMLEQKYPGISRGVLLKSGKQGHGEYNQSVSPGSILIELGGINNTLQECYNTAEAFAEVLSSYIKDHNRKPQKI